MTDIEFVKDAVAEKAAAAIDISESIWALAETSFEEYRSVKLLTEALTAEGFNVERCIAGIPTAFKASVAFGSGRPVIGILGEYDALETLSQEAAVPVKSPLKGGAAGHGCGHNLLGAGSALAAIVVKDYLKESNGDGTVVFFGCPAEEGAGSKQFMARAGIFSDVDFVYTWHPDSVNTVSNKGNVAIMGAEFDFLGVTAHAGGSPQLGRSSLDACELMNIGANYLREHMEDKARIHYAYLNPGGPAANVIPDFARIKYEVRAPKVAQMNELFERVVNCGMGAALMSGTDMEYRITMAFSDYFANSVLAKVADSCFSQLGAPSFDESDKALAGEFLRTFNDVTRKNIAETSLLERGVDYMAEPLDTVYHPYNPLDRDCVSGSTDVGDVCYAAPTLNINVATAAFGTVWHSWQTTAQSNSSIGNKGMLKAAEVLALSCIVVAKDPSICKAARDEWLTVTGGRYVCPLPDDVMPPIGAGAPAGDDYGKCGSF